VKRAMLLVDAALRGKYQARMLLQVHDELVLERLRRKWRRWLRS